MKTSIGAAAAAITLIASQAAHAQGCVGDVAVDGRVDGGDLGVLLANWGPVTSSALSRACDFDNSGQIDGADLGALLAGWGACPLSSWATILETQPDPAIVTDPALRAGIAATGLPWRVRDNGTGIEMLLVPPGTFQMGCVLGSDLHGCYGEELPVHAVTLTSAFYLGRYEVTQAQWAATMGSSPSLFQASNGYPGSTSRPVERVSWNAIQDFLNAVGMRLPTEAEWEYACRAGTQTPFYNGSTDDSTLVSLAWSHDNTCSTPSGCGTREVGQKAPNRLGFHDMLGNVWEWTLDWYGGYSGSRQVNPTGPNVESAFRVARGQGSFAVSNSMRASYRGYFQPGFSQFDIGFRVARNP